MDEGDLPLLIYDGDCGFCTASATWAARDWTGPARAVPWQTLGADGLARLGLEVRQAEEAAWWVDAGGGLAGGHRAVGEALRAGRGWRHLAGTLVLAPALGVLAAGAYRVLSRHRHRLPGATAACRSDGRLA